MLNSEILRKTPIRNSRGSSTNSTDIIHLRFSDPVLKMKIKTQDQIISSLASSSSTSSLQSPRLRIRSIWIIFSSLLLVLLYFLSSDLDNHPLRPHSLLSFFNSIQFHPFFDSYLSDLHSHSPAFALRDESDHDWDQVGLTNSLRSHKPKISCDSADDWI